MKIQIHFLLNTNNFKSMMIIPARNMRMEMRLMPCMYFIHCVRGSLGSRLRRYRYSPICFHTPIVCAVIQMSFEGTKKKTAFYCGFRAHGSFISSSVLLHIGLRIEDLLASLLINCISKLYKLTGFDYLFRYCSA